MAGEYVVPADFRAATLAEYCVGLSLAADEIDDTTLASVIAAISARVDSWCNDHFATLTSTTYELDGSGGARLFLPSRCTAVTTVSVRGTDGGLTVQDASAYRLHSSLNSTGSSRVGEYDWLDVVPTHAISPASSWDYVGTWDVGLYGLWPTGPQTVRVTGTFGWTVTPPEIKRLVALLAWDRVKGKADVLRTASGFGIGGANVTTSTGATGYPEADSIISDFRRDEPLGII